MDNLLVGNKQGIQDSKTSRKNIRIKFNILGKEVIRSCRKLGCSYTQPAWSGLWTFKFHPNQNYRSETSPGPDQKAKPWSETNKTVVRFSWDFHVRLSEIWSNDVIKVNWKTSQDIFGQDRRALLILVHFSPFIPVIMEGYPPIWTHTDIRRTPIYKPMSSIGRHSPRRWRWQDAFMLRSIGRWHNCNVKAKPIRPNVYHVANTWSLVWTLRYCWATTSSWLALLS